MSKVRDFAEIISTGVASTDVSGLTTAITNEFTSIEHIASSHIKTTLLYPAISGNITNGTAHTGTYGDTVQTDGHKYYYTDIKGSKPIKDPRIGAHFGSQRHMFKSIQLLEQETATHGDNVYSIDGREWMRGVGSLTFVNGTGGVFVKLADVTTSFFEITGYFNAFNYIGLNSDTNRSFKIEIDGVTATTTFNPNGVVNSPLALRYVSSGSVFNVDLTASSSLSSDTTLGIHTIRISWASGYSNYPTGCELIAQDTTSTTTKSQIQIPSQNVVSYGKKFTVSGTPHYNPFAQDQAGTDVDIDDTTSHGSVATGWAGTGSGYFDDTLDTATSLGLSAWVQNSKYYRPVNGGRIVKWVDSSGDIKTSVNMMPPAGTSIGASSDTNTPEANSWTTNYQPLFSSTTIDHSQAEVAKTFHWREFGNGSANGNASYNDFSTVEQGWGARRVNAYVMDDGLTSLSLTEGMDNGGSLDITSGSISMTFIGTGFSADSLGTGVQNLPYGTHILKQDSSADNFYCDGIDLGVQNFFNNTTNYNYSIHQPKMPPIPEDACIIADYMLMADFVPVSSTAPARISKGTRAIGTSRDVFCDVAGAIALYGDRIFGFDLHGTNMTVRLPMFATNYVQRGYQSDTRTELYRDSSTSLDSSATKDNTATYDSYAHLTSDLVLGLHNLGWNAVSGQNANSNRIEIATPIHTSSHYQTFETPFLHELVGGDRNMEQTNLVVTPDGKTWDEVTRDVSYIGNTCLIAHSEAHQTAANSDVEFDVFRGQGDGGTGGDWGRNDHYQKDFAIAYGRFICLKDGEYRIEYETAIGDFMSGNAEVAIHINGVRRSASWNDDAAPYRHTSIAMNAQLKRSDYVIIRGVCQHNYHNFQITRT